MKEYSRSDAVDAASILNDFIGDIVVGVITLLDYREKLQDVEDNHALIAVQKMCLSYLILTLHKWTEFYNRYNGIFDDERNNLSKELKKSLSNKNIVDFRNKCIGHIWDKKKKRPLYNSEINNHINAITENDLESYLHWLHNPNGNKYPETVVSIVENCRNYLVSKHLIHHDEIMSR